MNGSRIRAVSMLVVMTTLSSGSTALAQQPSSTTPRANTEKLMLSLALGGTSISSDDFEDERENGGGFSAQLGWGFTRRFMLLVDASGSVMNDDDEDQFVLVHGDLLGRFHFVSPTRAWVPFIEGGISARVAGQDDAQIVGENGQPQSVDLEISGGGITFGGGLRYHVSPAVALGASLRFTVGEFSTVKFNNVSIDGFELDATSTRLMFGVTWQPMLRKN